MRARTTNRNQIALPMDAARVVHPSNALVVLSLLQAGWVR